MSHINPAPSLAKPVSSESLSPEGKESTFIEMVPQDEQIQSLSSQDAPVGLRDQRNSTMEEKETDGEEMSLKGTLRSCDLRRDGCSQEEQSQGDSLVVQHPAHEASHVRNVAEKGHGNKVELVQEKLKTMRVCDEGGQAELFVRKENNCPAGKKEGQGGSVRVGIPQQLGHDHSAVSGPKSAEVVPSNEKTRAGVVGGERREGQEGKGGTWGGGGGESKREAEAGLFFTQSSEGCQQTFHQENPSAQQPGDSIVHSLHSSHSEPSMTTSHYPPSSSSSYTRSQSLQTGRRNEHYDILLIYTKEDESACADHFRSYAASKDWKVTSTAELPIGPLSLGNFRKAMECCSYVVLLISSHFISDKACERHYNIAIQYGDKHPEFTDCVLPIVFGNAELPPELDAIQHVRWGHQYFDTVMTKSVDPQKRYDRELLEASSVTSLRPNRANSIDASIPITSSFQMASTPPTLSTVPAGPDPCQTSPTIQQPPVTRVPEQEACLMPSDNESPVLPPIPVAATTVVGTTQSVAKSPPANPPHHAATSGSQPRAVPGPGYQSLQSKQGLPTHPSLPPATFQQQATYQQQAIVAATSYHPSHHSKDAANLPSANSGVGAVPQNAQCYSAQLPHENPNQPHATSQPQASQYPQPNHPEAIASISQQSGSAMTAQPSLQVTLPHQPLTPATCQPQATYQQQTSVAATQYQPMQYPGAGAGHLQQSLTSPPIFPPQFQRAISHPAQDYANMTGEEIFRSLSPGLNPGQAASQMLSVKRFGKICELLDTPDIRGYDWRLLAEILDLTQPQIRVLEQNPAGATRALLEVFFLKNGTEEKVEVLINLRDILQNMERHDAAEHVEREIVIAKCQKSKKK